MVFIFVQIINTGTGNSVTTCVALIQKRISISECVSRIGSICCPYSYYSSWNSWKKSRYGWSALVESNPQPVMYRVPTLILSTQLPMHLLDIEILGKDRETYLHLLIPTFEDPANHGSNKKTHLNVTAFLSPSLNAGLSCNRNPFRNQCTVCLSLLVVLLLPPRLSSSPELLLIALHVSSYFDSAVRFDILIFVINRLNLHFTRNYGLIKTSHFHLFWIMFFLNSFWMFMFRYLSFCKIKYWYSLEVYCLTAFSKPFGI